MALSPKQISLFLLLALFSSSIQARDSQFFNKLPSTTNTNNLPEQDQPDFIPDNENGHGLYGHESGQLPPSTATDSDQPPRKYLPKNYNPVAYVTEPEDINDSVSFTEQESNNQKNYATNPTNYFNGAQDFYNPDESAYKSYPTTTHENKFYGSSFNSDPARFNSRGNYFDNGAGTGADSYQPQEMKDTSLFGSRENYFDTGAGDNGYQPQGMSDTRFLANGRYHYNIQSGRYSTDHPYERLRGARPTYGGDREVNGEFP